MNYYSFDELKIGMEESFSVEVDSKKLDMFRDITGDTNLLHNDTAAARERGYADRVVFGMLSASFMSTLAGVYLPGDKALIQSVESKFLKPVIVGERLTVTGKIVDMNDTVRRIELSVVMKNEKDERVLKGKMQVLVNG